MNRRPRTDSAFTVRRRRRRSTCAYRLLLPLVLLVGGCGGDGGDDGRFSVDPDGEGSTTGPVDDGDSTVPGNGGTGDGTGVNGELSGKLVFALGSASADYSRNSVIELDLRSGRYSLLTGNSSLASNDLFRSRVSLSLEPDRSSPPRLIGTATRCSEEFDETTCVLFMNADASIDSAFIVPNGSAGSAKRSRDGRFVALMTPGSGLELYDTAGERLSVNAEIRFFGAGTGAAYDWTPDGRIVFEYTSEPAPSGPVILARTLPNSTEIDTFITLPERYEGDVQSIDVSPSGDRAAILIDGEDQTNGTYEYRRPAVLDLQSLAVYEPLAVEPGASMDAQGLSWSPDGRWLAFRRVWQSEPVPFIGSLPISPIYAVRTDGGRYALPVEPSGSTDKIRMLVMRPLNGSDGSFDPGNQTSEPSVWRE